MRNELRYYKPGSPPVTGKGLLLRNGCPSKAHLFVVMRFIASMRKS